MSQLRPRAPQGPRAIDVSAKPLPGATLVRAVAPVGSPTIGATRSSQQGVDAFDAFDSARPRESTPRVAAPKASKQLPAMLRFAELTPAKFTAPGGGFTSALALTGAIDIGKMRTLQKARDQARLPELWQTPERFYDRAALLPRTDGPGLYLLAANAGVLAATLKTFEQGYGGKVDAKVEAVGDHGFCAIDIAAILPAWLVTDVTDSYRDAQREGDISTAGYIDTRKDYFCYTFCALFDQQIPHYSAQPKSADNWNAYYADTLGARSKQGSMADAQFGSAVTVRKKLHSTQADAILHFATAISPDLLLHKPGMKRIELASTIDFHVRYGMSPVNRYHDAKSLALNAASAHGVEEDYDDDALCDATAALDDFLSAAWADKSIGSYDDALALAKRQKLKKVPSSEARAIIDDTLRQCWRDRAIDAGYDKGYLEVASPRS